MPDTGLQNLPSFSPGAGARRHGAGTSRVRKGTQQRGPSPVCFVKTRTLSLSPAIAGVRGSSRTGPGHVLPSRSACLCCDYLHSLAPGSHLQQTGSGHGAEKLWGPAPASQLTLSKTSRTYALSPFSSFHSNTQQHQKTARHYEASLEHVVIYHWPRCHLNELY